MTSFEESSIELDSRSLRFEVAAVEAVEAVED
jgi:hypothetical protein